LYVFIAETEKSEKSTTVAGSKVCSGTTEKRLPTQKRHCLLLLYSSIFIIQFARPSKLRKTKRKEEAEKES